MAITENRALKHQSIAPVPDAPNINTSFDGRGLP
jgi:hypothetical protein